MLRTVAFVWLVIAYTHLTCAQGTSATGTPTRMILTADHQYGRGPKMITKEDLIVTQRYEVLPVTKLISLRDDPAGLELFLLIDDSSDWELGSKLEEMRRFVGSQPPTTAVGVAYIQDGRIRVSENPIRDHERAARLVNAPGGSSPTSPFSALTELIQSWRQGSTRRVVILISHGIDPAATDALQDPSAEAAIQAAQHAGVTVYTLYHPSVGYLAADSSQIRSGQVKLAHVASETGGQAYFLDFAPLPSLTPFLSDVADHLANQYLLEFLAKPSKGPGRLQEITLKSKVPGVELISPYKVWILGSDKRSGTD